MSIKNNENLSVSDFCLCRPHRSGSTIFCLSFEMSAAAAAYPKLHKIYKELVRQNETIFVAEKERNVLEEKFAFRK